MVKNKDLQRVHQRLNALSAHQQQMSSYMQSAGAHNDKTEAALTEIQSSLKSQEANAVAEDTVGKFSKGADAALNTTTTVLNSIDKFKSGDPTQEAMAVLDIVSQVSQFAALAGPEGEVVAAVLGPLCSIVSAILGATSKKKKTESQEHMLKRVITEALRVQTADDLKSVRNSIWLTCMDLIRGALVDLVWTM